LPIQRRIVFSSIALPGLKNVAFYYLCFFLFQISKVIFLVSIQKVANWSVVDGDCGLRVPDRVDLLKLGLLVIVARYPLDELRIMLYQNLDNCFQFLDRLNDVNYASVSFDHSNSLLEQLLTLTWLYLDFLANKQSQELSTGLYCVGPNSDFDRQRWFQVE
jgi:hypothetical protein